MKNLKLGKKVGVLFTSLCLFTGCSSNDSEPKEDNNQQEERSKEDCTHLTLNLYKEPVVFRECDGFDIHFVIKYGHLSYIIYEEKEKILDGYTNDFQLYYVEDHKFINNLEKDIPSAKQYVYKKN